MSINPISIGLSAILLLASCHVSRESKIEQAFEDYVDQNFRHPSDFDGIVSVTPYDTLDSHACKMRLKALHDRYDSLTAFVMGRRHPDVERTPGLKARWDSLLTDYTSTLQDRHYNFVADYEAVMAGRDTMIYQVMVAYRMKNDAPHRVNHYYVGYGPDEDRYEVTATPQVLPVDQRYMRCGMMYSYLNDKLSQMARLAMGHDLEAAADNE